MRKPKTCLRKSGGKSNNKPNKFLHLKETSTKFD